MEFWFAAFSLGLLGSFHCVGMCGPIALALPLKGYGKIEKVIGALLYNFGRATTYSLFGFLLGLIGGAVLLAGMQRYFSISVGVLILIVVLLPKKYSAKLEQLSWLNPVSKNVRKLLAELFRTRSFSSLFLIGSLNGFLPCGLVYAALAGALATGNAMQGSVFMILFGLGTIPLMLAVNLSGNWININLRNRIRKAVPVFVAAMAILLILRGMNLGIPYISPAFVDLPTGSAAVCH